MWTKPCSPQKLSGHLIINTPFFARLVLHILASGQFWYNLNPTQLVLGLGVFPDSSYLTSTHSQRCICGKDDEPKHMPNRSPHEGVNQREASRVVGAHDKCCLLGTFITSFLVSLTVLEWKSSFLSIGPLEGEESPSTKCQAGSICCRHDKLRLKLGTNHLYTKPAWLSLSKQENWNVVYRRVHEDPSPVNNSGLP